MTDPIADFLIRILNAQKVGHLETKMPFSKVKLELAKILEKGNFIKGFEESGKDATKTLIINLKYNNNEPAIHQMKRISKPGQRIYLSKDKIIPVKNGYGIAVISTSKGLMTNKEAKKEGLGGEIMCEIW